MKIDIQDHMLVPKHEIMTEEEISDEDLANQFTEEELVVPTYFLWRSDNDADYGIITKVRVPQSLDDIVGRYTNDGEEYISNKMLGNYTELS